MSTPLVSVVIPAYNSEDYIAEAIDSVISQTYSDYELIVVNDGSKDATKSVISEYKKQITIINTPNHGVSVARNIGILAANGEYIAFLDSDDVWHPEKLEIQVNYLNKNQDVLMVCNGRIKFMDTEEIEIKKSNYFIEKKVVDCHTILHRNPIHCSSVLVRKNAFPRSGLFTPGMISAQDTELWARIAKVGTIVLGEESLSWLRTHDKNTTKTYNYKLNRLNSFKIMEQHWSEDPIAVEIIRKNLNGNVVAVAYEASDRKDFKNAKLHFKKAYLLNPLKLKYLLKYFYYTYRNILISD